MEKKGDFMKLINYNYGYNNTFNCSIHGKIIVSPQEWEQIKKYLFNPAVKHCYLFKDVLNQDMQRIIKVKDGFLCNIRTTATEFVVKRFNIEKYKQGNYMFFVSNIQQPTCNWIIQGRKTGEYWNNNIGWTNKALATRFSLDEVKKFLYLPVGSKQWRMV